MSLSQAAAALILLALGGLAGVLLSGWLADYMTYRGIAPAGSWSPPAPGCSGSRCSC